MQSLIPGDVIVNGIKIHYYRSVETPRHAAPTLVMLHGITDSGLCWPRTVKALAGEYALVLPDARGHGLSDKPATGYAPADHAADVAGLIRALDLDRPALIGHSMGGGVAGAAAARYPDLVGGAILEDPAWFSADHASAAQRAERAAWWRNTIIARQSKTPEQVIAERKAEQPAWDEEEFPDWAVAKFQVSPDVGQFDPATISVSWQETARAIRCPTLLITADVAKGAIVTPEMAAEAQRINPNIQVAHFPAAGHNIRREDFAAYLAAVRSFLAELA
jgi:pimeloyl-ACP methyl ester carboxylesterase